jgi:hypothetical protein
MSQIEAPPLFARILGGAFESLPSCVIALHRRQGVQTYRGEVEVERGRNVLARFLAWLTDLPPARKGPIEVEIIAEGGREQWTRRVGPHAMRSRLWADDDILCERLGAVEFGFRLVVESGELIWRTARVRAFGFIPLPASWFAGVGARESAVGGATVDQRYRFDVRAAMPVIGLLVHYRGWLVHVDEQATEALSELATEHTVEHVNQSA